MTKDSPGRYTDLDLLKQIAAQGFVSANVIDKMLNPEARAASTPEEVKALQTLSASLPQEIKTAIAHLKVLQALINTAKTYVARFDPDHYSDGRPIISPVDAGGSEYLHVWQADPDHPFNHPAPGNPSVAVVPNSSGQLFKVFIAESHEIGVIELGDENRDRA